jgi:hypothetical protein
VSDWLDKLDGDERANWDRFVDNVRKDALHKIAESAFVVSLVPDGEPDIKFAVELGLSIMLDKPLLFVVSPGTRIPDALRRVADEIVVADVDLEEGRQAIAAAMERIDRDTPG